MSISFRTYHDNDNIFGEDYHKICEFLLRINREKITTSHFLWARWVRIMSVKRGEFLQRLINKIGIWEDQEKIVATICFSDVCEEAVICCDPNYNYLKEEATMYAAKSSTENGSSMLIIPDEDKKLKRLAFKNGFIQQDSKKEQIMAINIYPELTYTLPDGFSILSMDKGWDFNKYNKIICRGFNFEMNPPFLDEKELEGRKIRLASPHVNQELVIAIISPNGNYASHCGLWHISGSSYAYIDPVATDPDFREKGLAKAAIFEAMLRASRLGAKKAYVCSQNQFYRHIGFKEYSTQSGWVKT